MRIGGIIPRNSGDRMKKLVVFLLMLPLLAAGGGQVVVNTGNHRKVFISSGSISVKGTPVCGVASYATSETVSYTAAATGDELFVELWNVGANIAITSVAYNGSSASTVIAQSAGNQYASISEVTGISSGAQNVTWTNASAYGTLFCFIEFTGVNSTGNVNTTNTAGSPYSTSLSITESNGYVLGQAVGGASSAQTPSATSGTIPAYYAAGYKNTFTQYNTAASPGSVSLAGTLTSSVVFSWNTVELKY